MGTSPFSVPSLEHLVLNQYRVVAVYTQPDRPSGRGRQLVSSPVKRSAEGLGLPVVQPASLKEAGAVAQLRGFSPDVIVVAAFGQILPRPVLDLPARGCINIHPSLLPKYRGASPVAAAILAGDRFAGVSLMLMDAGLDSGPVLARAQIPVSRHDTTGSLTAKLSTISARLLLDVLVHWLRGELIPQPQNEAEATHTGLIAKEAGAIDWHLAARDIWRRVRAFQPWPGAYTTWRGKQLRIIGAVPLAGEGEHEVGRVVALSPAPGWPEDAFGVSTGDGVLGVLKLQLEGKRTMSAAEFLRGQRQFIGATLLSS